MNVSFFFQKHQSAKNLATLSNHLVINSANVLHLMRQQGSHCLDTVCYGGVVRYSALVITIGIVYRWMTSSLPKGSIKKVYLHYIYLHLVDFAFLLFLHIPCDDQILGRRTVGRGKCSAPIWSALRGRLCFGRREERKPGDSIRDLEKSPCWRSLNLRKGHLIKA